MPAFFFPMGKEKKKWMKHFCRIAGDIDKRAWRRLHSAYQTSIPRGSKVTVTSRSENITNFGTTQALNLKFLPREAYWYFFRTLVFGSTDPEEHPELASIAMAIIDEYFDQGAHKAFTGPFMYLNNVASILKGCVGAQAWRQSLECLRENWKQNEVLSSSRSLGGSGMENDRMFLRRETRATEYCVVHSQDHRIVLDDKEAPKINLLEVIFGSVPPQGKFEVLVWKSHLVPYHKHIYSFEILEFARNKVSRNKQVQKRKNFS
ncbi:hypothetical protein U9M48_011411 [Paspalum notatum var. saurae]|uniref:Uncharacterized protein n=1 Tax=Paspalum notatum var. saurae TaxID=547442 RepID=A0AAQ3SXA1_PASNO